MCKKILIITCCVLGSLFSSLHAQNVIISGTIANYAQKPLIFYKCFGDTIVVTDSTQTDNNGVFAFTSNSVINKGFQKIAKGSKEYGLYKIALQKDQFFYFLYDPKVKDWGKIEIKTLYKPDAFYNIATDSLEILSTASKKKESAGEVNKIFFEFQQIQQKINVANYFLVQMMRVYPLPDPFHIQIENEFFARYKEMNKFVSAYVDTLHATYLHKFQNNLTVKLAVAYYQQVLPDWKQPDTWRDSIIALHFFDYFNPADSFYLQTNILPEKMEVFMQLKKNKRDAYGQPIKDEMFAAKAAQEFLEKTRKNQENFDFCLNFFLKKFNKERLIEAFLYVYDIYSKPLLGDCSSSNTDLNWAREKASILQGIKIGSEAPDFEISPVDFFDNPFKATNGTSRLHQLQSEYTLILFWATWCPHCTFIMPKIKEAVDNFNVLHPGKKLMTVAFSLDSDKDLLKNYLTAQSLQSFINFSDYKGWQSDVVKKYNVFATPTMFLLDNDKKILAKPETIQQLNDNLDKIKK